MMTNTNEKWWSDDEVARRTGKAPDDGFDPVLADEVRERGSPRVGSAPSDHTTPDEASCGGCAKVSRHPGEGYQCAAHPNGRANIAERARGDEDPAIARVVALMAAMSPEQRQRVAAYVAHLAPDTGERDRDAVRVLTPPVVRSSDRPTVPVVGDFDTDEREALK